MFSLFIDFLVTIPNKHATSPQLTQVDGQRLFKCWASFEDGGPQLKNVASTSRICWAVNIFPSRNKGS